MSAIPNYTITKMMVGPFEVAVPPGLSELLNEGGCWGPKQDNPKPRVIDEYDCEDVMIDGRIISRFTPKSERRSKSGREV